MGPKLAPVNRYSPLQLAYLGDGVYELYIRRYLLSQGFFSPGKLNKLAKNYVAAPAQSRVYLEIEERLSEEEKGFLRRGRNAKGGPGPASASAGEYRRATGLECLIGGLYVQGRQERIEEIMEMALEVLGKVYEEVE